MLRDQNSAFDFKILIKLAFTRELTRAHVMTYHNVFDNVEKKVPVFKLKNVFTQCLKTKKTPSLLK